jgi:hypothetical protein
MAMTARKACHFEGKTGFCYIGYIRDIRDIGGISYKPMSQPLAQISSDGPTSLLAFSYVTDVTENHARAREDL